MRSASDEELDQDTSRMTDVQREQLEYDKFEQEKRDSVLKSSDRGSSRSHYDTQENEQDRIQREGQARRREIEKNDELTKSGAISRKDDYGSSSDSSGSSSESSTDDSSDHHHHETEYISLADMKSLLLTRDKFQNVKTKLKVAEIVDRMFVQIHDSKPDDLRVFIVSGLVKSEAQDKSIQYKLKIVRPGMRKEQSIGVDKISNKPLSEDAYNAIIKEAKSISGTEFRILESKPAKTKIEENKKLINQVDSEKDILEHTRDRRTIIDEKMEAENRLAQARENGDQKEIELALEALKEIDSRSVQRKKIVVRATKTRYDVNAFSNPEVGFGRLYNQEADSTARAETQAKPEKKQRRINLAAHLAELHDFDVKIDV